MDNNVKLKEWEAECIISNLTKERNEALYSLDKEKLLNYFKKYNIPIPHDELEFWANVHKERLYTISIPDYKKKQSFAWLIEHEFNTNDLDWKF